MTFQTWRSGLTIPVICLPLVTALVLYVSIPSFGLPGNLNNIGFQVAPLLIAASGQLLVVLIGCMDLSLGAVIGLSSAILVTVENPGLAMVLTFGSAVLVGVVNGWGVGACRVHPLVMTLASATFVQGAALMILPVPGNSAAPELIKMVVGTVAGLPVAWAACGLVFISLNGLLNWTRFGLHLFATGADADSARLSGVCTLGVVIGAHVVCSILAAVVGLLLTVRVGAGDPNLGLAYSLESLAAVAIGGVVLSGGRGSVAGAWTGALTLAMINNGINLASVSPFLRTTITGALLLGAAALQRRREIGL